MFLIFLFDGTQNGLDDQYPTNVRIISELADIPGQKVFYFEGPGNDERDVIDHLLGNAFGYGMAETRRVAHDILRKEYQEGDKIIVFSFSRGAASSRMWCSEIAQDGNETEFLGCFDTVFARLPFGWFQQDTLFGDLHVSRLVKNARHALSIDEDRQAFAPNQMNARPGVVEMWFPGNHADIGGGYEQRGLADNSLHWMISEAHTASGVHFLPVTTKQHIHAPHREALPLLREKRRPCVMVDGELSEIPPQLHVWCL